jgi:hypothetical protein
MRRHSGYFLGCCGAAFAVASFLVGLEVSAKTAAPSLQQQPAPVVNRMLKSDRQRLVPVPSRNAVNDPIEIKSPALPRMELPEGCEPMISTIGQSPLARIPGRCVS